jgi:hypothetical protein
MVTDTVFYRNGEKGEEGMGKAKTRLAPQAGGVSCH